MNLIRLTYYFTVKQVAFSASLMASASGNVGPFNTQTPLVFRHVVANIGNAYNPNTGTAIWKHRKIFLFTLLNTSWFLIIFVNKLTKKVEIKTVLLYIFQDFSLPQWEEPITLSSTYMEVDMHHMEQELCWSRMEILFSLHMNTRLLIL